MIDTHSHLLPWVDHGCPDLETSVLMARAAASSGVHIVACTPHLAEIDETLIQRARDAMGEVRAALAKGGVELKLLLGFEVDLVVAALSEPAMLGDLAIEGSGGALLLETPFQGWPLFMEEALFRLSAAGLRPVLAHPERNDQVQKTPDLLDGCVEAGAIIQATAASTTGEFGREAEKAFFALLTEGRVSLLATDAHAYRTEGWTLTPLLDRLEGLIPQAELHKLIAENPARLLAGESLLDVSPAGTNSTMPRKTERRSKR